MSSNNSKNRRLVEKLLSHEQLMRESARGKELSSIKPLRVSGQVYSDLDLDTWEVPVGLVWFDHCVFERSQFPRHAYGIGLRDGSASDCDMAKTVFNGGSIERFRFSRCNLAKASMVGVVLDEVSFHRCDLRRISFRKAQLRNVEFVDCQLDGISLRSVVVFEDIAILGDVRPNDRILVDRSDILAEEVANVFGRLSLVGR